MFFYKFLTYGTIGLGVAMSAFSGCYVMTQETVFDHLKGQVLDPNASDEEWKKLDKNIKTWGGDWTDRLDSFTKISLKYKLNNYTDLKNWCRDQYKSTYKSLFGTISPIRMLEIRSVCIMSKSKSEILNISNK